MTLLPSPLSTVVTAGGTGPSRTGRTGHAGCYRTPDGDQLDAVVQTTAVPATGPLRPHAAGRGWRPRSADPAAELPGLILALDERHGPFNAITRIMVGMAGGIPAGPVGCRSAAQRAAEPCGSAGSRPCPPACSSRPAPAASEPTCSPSPRMAATRPPGRPWTRPPGRQPQSRSRPPGRRHQAGQDGPRRNRDGICEHRAGHLGMGGRPAARPRGGARPLAAHGSGPAVTRARSRGRHEMLMTSGATARHTGSHPQTGLAADRTIVRLRGALDFAAAPAPSRVSSCDPGGASRADRRATPHQTAWHRGAPGRPQPAGLEATAAHRPGPQTHHLSRSRRRARRGTARARGPVAASPGRLEHSP